MSFDIRDLQIGFVKEPEENQTFMPEINPNTLQNISDSELFDPVWYADKYQDVRILGMEPCEHFLRYGRLMKRSPGPDFDTRFYLRTYADAGASSDNPLIHFLNSEDRARRQTSAENLYDHMQSLSQSTQDHWLPGKKFTQNRPIISYCIPVKGRLEDLSNTLKFNLSENERFRGKVEFLIIEFDADTDVLNWVTENFPQELSDGYLRVVSDFETLDSWHFGRAKNAFRAHMHGLVYSSLDADNFVTGEETELLLDLTEKYPLGFIFHHFSGEWGDGTSGRLSLPAAVYRHVGYNEKLLPRQFDEMDIILGALTELPALPFIGINKDRHVFLLPGSAKSYFEGEKLQNRKIFIGDTATYRVAPLNPRGVGYTDKNILWRDMGNINAALSGYWRSYSSDRKPKYLERIVKYKHRLIESMSPRGVIETLFQMQELAPFSRITKSDICIIACVHDEEVFLPKFVDHHRKLGATHFLFIDDHSAHPVRDLDLGPNVLALRPKIGDFRTCKTLWIEGLLKAVIPQGTWVCTLDADEMLQVPEPFDSLQAVARQLEENGKDFATCFLLDMLPDPTTPAHLLSDVQQNFDTIFTSFCDHDAALSETYRNHHSVKWGFGPHADMSYRLDARHHAFGTFDSLRKHSMFRYRPKRHLNQGFHQFHFSDATSSPGHDIWENAPILPIFHYKLVRLFSDAMRKKMLNKANGYHARTSQNINDIFGGGEDTSLTKLAQLLPYLRPAKEARAHDFFDRP